MKVSDGLCVGGRAIHNRERPSFSKLTLKMAAPHISFFLWQRSGLEAKYQHTSTLVRTKSSFCRREPLACIWAMLLETYMLEPRFSYLLLHGLQSQIPEVM